MSNISDDRIENEKLISEIEQLEKEVGILKTMYTSQVKEAQNY